jgi:multisubunit Na+/H+ antiporter MnhF subunit
MMMNCMNTGTGALTVAGVRLADVALTLTGLLLVLLAVIATVAVARFGFDLAHRFSAHSSTSMVTPS